MINVSVRTNTIRETKLVDPSTTVRAVLTDCNVPYQNGGITIDGMSLIPGDLDKSFEALNITEECLISQVVKADGGIA